MKYVKKYRNIILIVLIVAALLYYNPGREPVPAEKIDVLSGIGVDLAADETGQAIDLFSISTYTFSEKEKVKSMTISGSGLTIPDTRASRQLKSNRKLLIAAQKVIIMSEDMSRSGIEDIMDALFANQYMNDMSWVVVCKGKALDILQKKIDEYPSSSDFIDGMVENCKEYKFFSDNYKVMDMLVRIGAEGRNLVLPYIEDIDGVLQITGVALFKKDKMVKKIDIGDTKTMNMLRENGTKGALELRKDLKSYLSIYGKMERKVSCQKTGPKYSFTIDLSFKGDVFSNTLAKGLEKKSEVIDEYEHEIARQTEKRCQEFIDKMKNDYKVDCLELGWLACAKYGRNTGVDWNEIVSGSDIKVNVKVEIKGFGRGRYAEVK